jgi:hypothetical protein
MALISWILYVFVFLILCCQISMSSHATDKMPGDSISSHPVYDLVWCLFSHTVRKRSLEYFSVYCLLAILVHAPVLYSSFHSSQLRLLDLEIYPHLLKATTNWDFFGLSSGSGTKLSVPAG